MWNTSSRMFLKKVQCCFVTARRSILQCEPHFKMSSRHFRKFVKNHDDCLRNIRLFIGHSLSNITKPSPLIANLKLKYSLSGAAKFRVAGVGSSFEGLSSRKDRPLYGRIEKSYLEIDANVYLQSWIAVDPDAVDDGGCGMLSQNKQDRNIYFSRKTCLEMQPSNTPGFVDVKISKETKPSTLRDTKDAGSRVFEAKDVLDDFRLRCEYSALVHNRFAEERVTESNQPEIHITTKFPAISVFTNFPTDKTSQCDFAITIPVRGWPHMCQEWMKRTRTSAWPCDYLVEKVIGKGCGLVPKPPKYRVPLPEWRLSFGEGEGILANHLSKTQRDTYIYFKDIVKHHLTHPLVRGIKSYHLKNIFFWALEKTPRERWTEKDRDDRINDMLDDLHLCLDKKMCPAYFIPKRNLFLKINDNVLMALSERLSVLKEEKRKFQFRPRYKSHWELDIELMTRVFEIQHKLQTYVHSKRLNRQQQAEAGKELLRNSMEDFKHNWPYDWKPNDPVSRRTLKNEMERILDKDFGILLAQYRWRLKRIAYPAQYKYLDRYSIDMAVTRCFQNFYELTLDLTKGNVDQMAPQSALALLRRHG